MKVVFEKVGEHWVELIGASTALKNAIKNGVKPTTHRKWDPNRNTWLIYYKHLKFLADTTRRLGHIAIWRSLPNQWQLIAAGAQIVTPSYVGLTTTNAHKTLYVQEDAPLIVIKAAYKALANLHHPDKGGNPETFIQIKNAYDDITKTLDKHE